MWLAKHLKPGDGRKVEGNGGQEKRKDRTDGEEVDGGSKDNKE